MIKNFAIISLLATSVLAASSTSSSSSAAASSTANPLIPSGISSGCSSFLTTLNSDPSLQACTAPWIAATSSFGPGSSSSSSANATTALNTLCSSNNGCTQDTLRSFLAQFYSACSAELTSNPVTDVVNMYDGLYMLYPLKVAVCSKDDSGKYCVTEMHKSSSSPAPSGLSNAIVADVPSVSLEDLYVTVSSPSPSPLTRRDQTPFVTPNTTTIGGSNLPFLFLQPNLSSADLCTTCTREILTAYINFESNVPSAIGLGSSPMLNGQVALYNAVQSTCGKNFLSGAVQAAGGLSNGNPFNGASRTITGDFQNGLAVILGAVTVLFASVF